MLATDAPGHQVGVREFRDHLTTLLREAAAGQSVLITAHGKVLAELRPPPPSAAPRRPGALRGQIRMAADFDATPDEVLDVMEGGGEGVG
jgi:antitoxin (DNA-binding transcriptional repressor) of toxin-antitoxin stability system